MTGRTLRTCLAALGLLSPLLVNCSHAPPPARDPVDAAVESPKASLTEEPVSLSDFPASDYWLATGRGDLRRGPAVCKRAADMAARAELAKLLRVQVQERATDRIRERTGRPIDQDIEVVREESANELLKDVRIVHRTVDQGAGTCSSIAAMPKKRIPSPSGQ